MARILAISSQVARGHIGLSATVPALQGLGHEVWPLPTVILSNHPGHSHAAGMRIEPVVHDQMIDALDLNGWLGEVDAVFTGYLPSAPHVDVAARLVRRLRSERSVIYVCDPVLGDDPGGLYVDAQAAAAIRSELLGLADVLTPNRFELAWLSGREARDVPQIVAAARTLSPPTCAVTSAARIDGHVLTVLVTRSAWARCETPWRENVPHGTGDLFAGLYLGHRLNGHADAAALGRAAAGVEQAIVASDGRDELNLSGSQKAWTVAAPLPIIAA